MVLKFILVWLLIAECRTTNEVDDFAEDAYKEEFGRIIHSSVLFRHGDRNPYAPYPFDPYKGYRWAEGLGQLTNAGKRRLFEVGQWFRRRYRHIIGERYAFIESKMESSDYDRSLMSAECFLAGFYPPSEAEIWHSGGLEWQPIPVHSIPLQYDNLIAMFKICDAYNYELFAANTAPKYQEMYKKHKKFFDYVGMSTGTMFNENFLVFGLLKLMEIYDSLNVQNQNNFTLPMWANSVFPEPMASIALKIFDIGTYTEKMRRLKSGPFLKSVTMDMFKKAYEQFEQNFHFYSGHDSTIATVMITLGIYDHTLPPYGTALIFELREKATDYIVTILYRNSTDSPPILMRMPECDNPCQLEDFLDLTKPYITEDWDKECQVQPVIPQTPVTNYWKYPSPDPWIFTEGQTIILIFVTSFLLLTMLYYSIKRNLTYFRTLLHIGSETQQQ